MRNKIQILFSILIVSTGFPYVAQAQTFEWIQSQTLNYQLNPDMLNYVVCNDDSGNIIYAGMDQFTEYYSDMFGDLFLKKFSTDGQELLSLQIIGDGLVEHLESKNNYYFLLGKFKDTISFPGQPALYTSDNSREYFIAVISNTGNTVSLLNISEMFPNASNLISFTVNEFNKLIFGISEGSNSRIIKMDMNGNLLQSIEQTNVSLINNVDYDPYGNMIVAGAFANTQSYFGGELFEVGSQDNMYVAKYNELGEIQWVTFVEDVLYNFHNKVKCDHTGNIYFAGSLFAPSFFGPFQANGPNWVFDFFLTKLNPDGEFQWLVEVPDGEITGDASVGNLDFLDIDQDNNVYISGFVRDTIDWGNGVQSTGNNYYDLLLLKFSPGGEIQWSKSGGGSSFVKSISMTTDMAGNCYMAGVGGGEMTFDDIIHYEEGFLYPFLVKLNSNMNVGIGSTRISDLHLDVYPNPAGDFIKLSTDSEMTELRIYNQSGHLVCNEDLNTKKYTHNTSDLETGLYLFRLETHKGVVSKQVIIE